MKRNLIIIATIILSTLATNSTNAQKYVSNLDFKVVENDIIVEFDLKSLNEREYYDIHLEVKLGNKTIEPTKNELSGDIGIIRMSGKKQIKWNDAKQAIGYFEGDMTIYVIATKYTTPTPVVIEPTGFTIKKQMPHYIIWGASAAAIGGGFALRAQSQDIYNNQYLTQTNEAAAEPFYQDANQKHHQYILLTRIGGGVLIANTAWYLIRRSKINKNADMTSNFDLIPSPDGTVGLGFSYSF